MDTLRSSSYNAAIAFLTTDALVWSADKWTKGDCIQLRGIRDARSHWPPVDSHTPPTVTDVEQPPRKMQIMVCIKSSIGQGSYNKAADNDIQLWFRAGADTLRNPHNQLYLLTDCVDIEVPQDVRATVWKIYPTQRQVERVIRFVTSNLREMDECTVWFSCVGRNSNVPALRLADRSEVTGRQLNMWLTEHTHPATLIRVGLDFCYSGQFLGLPWCFNSGRLAEQPIPQQTTEPVPRIICISACRSDEYAHHVAMVDDPECQFGGLLWYLACSQLEGNPNIIHVREVEERLSSYLSVDGGRWAQTPRVSMSYRDVDAVFQEWF